MCIMILFVSPTQINLLPTIFYFKAFSTTTFKKEDEFLILKNDAEGDSLDYATQNLEKICFKLVSQVTLPSPIQKTDPPFCSELYYIYILVVKEGKLY